MSRPTASVADIILDRSRQDRSRPRHPGGRPGVAMLLVPVMLIALLLGGLAYGLTLLLFG